MKRKRHRNHNGNLSEEELRRKAMELYDQGLKASDICSSLQCSKSWFYKWLNRSKTNGEKWFQSESRAPKMIHRSVDPDMEQLRIDTRKELRTSQLYQYGPQAIYYELEQQGYSPPPVWSIARILNRNQLTVKNNKAPYIAKGKKYPYDYALCHQMDYAGPRYLSCKTRYYFLNLIESDTHWSQTSTSENKTSDNACHRLISFWKIVGIPDFLQMDNDPAFWGSIKSPTNVGKVIRLCLLLQVTSVFIPQSEPWRNGIIEHFNNTMQSALLKTNHENLDELQKAAEHFDYVHNHNHHYSTQKGMTPSEAYKRFQYPLRPLEPSFKMPEDKIPLESGEIHFIRFVRSNLKFNIFGLSFPMPEKAKYEYILGVALIEEHRLIIYKDREYLTEFPFSLT